MKTTLKMWNDLNDPCRVVSVNLNDLNDLNGLKAAIKSLLNDWRNVEAFIGSNKVASIYNYKH